MRKSIVKRLVAGLAALALSTASSPRRLRKPAPGTAAAEAGMAAVGAVEAGVAAVGAAAGWRRLGRWLARRRLAAGGWRRLAWRLLERRLGRRRLGLRVGLARCGWGGCGWGWGGRRLSLDGCDSVVLRSGPAAAMPAAAGSSAGFGPDRTAGHYLGRQLVNHLHASLQAALRGSCFEAPSASLPDGSRRLCGQTASQIRPPFRCNNYRDRLGCRTKKK